MDEEISSRHVVRVYVGALSPDYEALSVEASKHTTAEEIVSCIVDKLGFTSPKDYELAEVIGDAFGQDCKERRLGNLESPVALKLLWPKEPEPADAFHPSVGSRHHLLEIPPPLLEQYRFCLREKLNDSLAFTNTFNMDPQILRDYFYRFLYQPKDKEYPDLCQLTDLNEETLLENLKSRFNAGHIYTYVGSILIAVNPFKFLPIYNPKYVKLYQNRRREELPPHIFSIADSAYHTMLKEKKTQCIIISGESGAGKTESTNFLLHHLTALSQKGTHGSGVEQVILSAGPVLEAYANAKTAHNNNSSRFGKFIQVSYRENGMVTGAIVQKYLLEKSRICHQAQRERNYHVFYYLLAGASDGEREALCLLPPQEYNYLNQSGCYKLEGVDEGYELKRLKQSMEMVGFGVEKQRKIFCVLSSVLLLGNIEFVPKKSSYHHDESVLVKNPQVVRQISNLLRVTEEALNNALTTKRARVSGEMLVIPYRQSEAVCSRDALAKCLYGALFDWIVLQVNHALLSKKDSTGIESNNKSIGVLDIFGFEDFGECNSFEQFCINFANEHLQGYFNLHVFKFEQEEYKKEQIKWSNIEFSDNTPCLNLFEAKPHGLICILDDQCNFPGATNQTLQQKFNSVHKNNEYYEVPPRRHEFAFIIRHYAGKVKYQVAEFREKNMDLTRNDIISVLKNSSLAFVKELFGIDPVAVFRWAILRAFFRAYSCFNQAGQRRRLKAKASLNRALSSPGRRRSSNEHLLNSGEMSDEDVPELPGRNERIITRMERIEQRGVVKYRPIRRSHHRTGAYSNYSGHSRPYPNVSGNHSHSHPYDGMGGVANGHSSHLISEFCGVSNSPCCSSSSSSSSPYSHNYHAKNRSFRSQLTNNRSIKNLQSIKMLASHTAAMGIQNKSYYFHRKQPLSVSAQFQQSLHSLMVTLNQANPFFIRCVKSNSDKIPNYFDDELVQRQLRYTGMLETVRIRQAGYNVRVSFDEFIQLYRILLRKGLDSNRQDVESFLSSLRLNTQNFQIGEQKIFLRESEKIKLDYLLHQRIMCSIVTIQRWFRALLERRHYIRLYEAVLKIQSSVRMVIAQRVVANMRMRATAATLIQKVWRGYRTRRWTSELRSGIVKLQARARGNWVRSSLREPLSLIKKRATKGHKGPEQKLQTVIRLRGDGEYHSGQSTDEAFISKGSSQEELEHDHKGSDHPDSDESSGVHEESENEGNAAPLVPPVPPRRGPAPSVPQGAPPINSESISALTIALTSSPFSGNYAISSSSPQHRGIPSAILPQEPSPSQGSPVAKERKGKKKGGERKNVEEAQNRVSYDEFGEDDKRFEGDFDGLNNKSPFQRATKTIRTFISGSGSNSKRPSKDEASEDSGGEERVDSSQPKSTHISHFKMMERDPHHHSLDEPPTSSKLPPLSLRPTRSLVTTGGGQEGLKNKIVSQRKRVGTVNSSASSFAESDENLLKGSLTRLDDAFAPPRSPLAGSSQSVDFLSPKNEQDQERVKRTDSQVRRTKSVSDNKGFESNLLPEKKALYHNWEKVTRFRRGDACDTCKKNMHTLFAPGVKCHLCKLFFHSKCIQNGVVGDCVKAGEAGGVPESKIISARKKYYRKGGKGSTDVPKPVGGRFSLTGTSEFTDRTDQIISGVKELKLMQEFISKKIYQLKNEGENQKENAVDRVFQEALKEFKENLVSTFSVANKSSAPLNIKYKDLIANFAYIMENVCKSEGRGEDFPTTMGVNAFRGFLNEFMNAHRADEKPKVSKGRRGKDKEGGKRAKMEEVLYLGHVFVTMVINIPTACEVCSSFIMWPIERGLVCQKCKLACHKKCHLKILSGCSDGQRRSTSGSESGIFGSPLCSLVPENGTVPVVVDQLVTAIELYGLRQEGLYRKSGVSSRIRELKNELEEGKTIDWELYPVNCLTSVLKSFFREMPEPLLTYELYDEFLRAADLSQAEDRVHTLFSILKKLPKINYDLMERLVFHLVRVASYEDRNRMNTVSLAIVFAPCILRTNKRKQVQDSLQDVSRQTMTIETILSEQLKKFKTTLSNIESIDSETHSFSVRLNSIRSSKIKSSPGRKSISSIGLEAGGIIHENEKPFDCSTPEPMSTEEEEEYITRHIQHLQDEKDILTQVLPSLSRTPSDEDLLSTDPEGESPGGSADDLRAQKSGSSPSPRQGRAQSLQYSKAESLAVASKLGDSPRLSPTRHTGTQPLLLNVVKNRGPLRKPPSRFVRNVGAVDFGEGDTELVNVELGGDEKGLNEPGASGSLKEVHSSEEDDEEPIIV